MSLSDWLSLTLVCILGAASPGPSLAVILSATQTVGRAGGVAAAIGHGLGVFVYACVAATSLSYVITHHATLFSALQIAGACLLIWLGARLLITSFTPTSAPVVAETSGGMTSSFLSGFAIAAFNPKIAAFFASLFSQFFAEGQPLGLHVGMATLAGLIDVVTYIIFVIALSGQMLRGVLITNLHVFNRALGSLLLLIGISLMISQVFTI
jgi:threonine/homoserine/homoserine lactone efflux protein